MTTADPPAVPKGTRMNNKVCIVTGAGSGRGIGWATVVRFAQEGARHIYVFDIDTTELPSLVSSLLGRYPDVQITPVAGDVTDEDAVKSMCSRAIDENGRLDVFFANAGGCKTGFNTLVKDMPADGFMGTMRLNALSCFLAAKHATSAIALANPESGKDVGGGSIVFTSSTGGIRSTENFADYGASKAAVISLAQTIAQENIILKNGVRVNAVCPGATRTGLVDTFIDAPSINSDKETTSIRMAHPEEIANMVLFLACDESSYCTGQHYVVDGGLTGSTPMERIRWEL